MIGWLGDAHVVLVCSLLRLRRSPEITIFPVMQPVMFTLLFTQVYGGAVYVQSNDYTQFLMAGVSGQMITFGTIISSIYTAKDPRGGITDRFRALLMAPSATPVVHTFVDLAIAVHSMFVMLVAGFMIGWRFQAGVGSFLLGVLLLLITTWCLSWVMLLLGVTVPKPQSVNSAGVIVLLPTSFVSNASAPSEALPDQLRGVAEWNSLSSPVQAVRMLFGNLDTAAVPEVWSLQDSVAVTAIAWVILPVVLPVLTVAIFRRRVVR